MDRNFIGNIDLLDLIVGNEDNDKILRFMNMMMRFNYNPDINGYTLLFMIPPDLSGLRSSQQNPELLQQLSDIFPGYGKDSLDKCLRDACKFATFAAIDFSPPQEQLNTERISSRSGAIPFATEYTTSEQLSITFIDNVDLSIYTFHQLWLHYVWDILDGRIKPDLSYLDPSMTRDNRRTINGYYQAIDYAASAYIVKYRTDLRTISYIGKAIGFFPQTLPSKELLGQRTTNELTTLPFSYFCAAYRSEVTTELTDQQNINDKFWILKEFKDYVETQFIKR